MEDVLELDQLIGEHVEAALERQGRDDLLRFGSQIVLKIAFV